MTVLGSFFEVSNLQASDEVEQGETLTVSANVTNTGNQQDTQTVEYRFDDLDTPAQTKNVTLGVGESTTVEFAVDTSGIDNGTYEHGIFTENDSATTNVTVLEGFFDVTIIDAPAEASAGETVNVTAEIENTGEATDEQTVEYDVTQSEQTVTVVDSDEDFGGQVVSALEDELPEQYNVTLVEDENAMDAVGQYDVFVMEDVDPSDLDVQAFVGATNAPQTGVVWLDGWGSDSDAIPELSDATGNPASTDYEDDGDSPVYFEVTQSHPIFDGVAQPGETVDIHTASYADRSWFGDYDGQEIATVAAQNTEQGGSAVAVDAANSTVLASSLARETYVENPYFTDAVNQILANSVTYASGGSISAEDAVSAQDDTATNVTLAPGESETVEFTYTLDDGRDPSADWLHTVSSEDDRNESPLDITIDRGNLTSTITDSETGEPVEGATVAVDVEIGGGNYTAVTDENGEYAIEDVPSGTHEVTISADGYDDATDDNQQEATISIVESDPAYFQVSNVNGPAEAEQGEEITVSATVTNTGDEAATQTILSTSSVSDQDFSALGAQEMMVKYKPQSSQQVTLAGGEQTTLEFTYSIEEAVNPDEYEFAVSRLQETKSGSVTVLAAGIQSASHQDGPGEVPDTVTENRQFEVVV